MAPRNMHTGASATMRPTAARGRSRTSSSSRTPAKRTAASASRTRPAPSCAPATRWWLLPLGAVLVIAVFGWAYYPVAKVQYRESRDKARLSTQLAALQARNDRLSHQVALLRTPEGVEDYARSELGLVKRGESVGVLVDENSAAEASAALAAPEIDSANTAEAAAGPWTAFLDMVFDVR